MWKFSKEPQSVYGIFIDGLTLYKNSFFRLFPFIFAYAVLAFLAGVFGGEVIKADVAVVGAAAPAGHVLWDVVKGPWIDWRALWITFVCQFIGLWLFTISLVFLLQKITQENWNYKKAIIRGSKKFPECFIAGTLYLMITLLGLFLVVFPGIFVYVLFAFVFFNILVDNDNIWRAFVHSAKLVLHEWWRTSFIILILMIALISLDQILYYVIEAPMIKTWLKEYPTIEIIGSSLVQSIISLILLPLTIVILTRQYFDLKIRYQKWRQMHPPTPKIVKPIGLFDED